MKKKNFVFKYLTSCFIEINAYPLVIVDNRYLPVDDINDEIFTLQQIGRSFLSSSNRYVEISPKTRQSFGQKYHSNALVDINNK